MMTRNDAHRTCEMISSSVNLQSSRWEALALTGGRGLQQPCIQNKQKKCDKPSKLRISFLGVPSFSSCLFESSSFRATLCASSLFRRSFCIPGSFELLNIHVINPGNHPMMDMMRRSDREGFPKDVKLNGEDGSVRGTLDRRRRKLASYIRFM